MNKLNVLTVAIGALLSTQAFASNNDFDVEAYGKVGGSILSDGKESFTSSVSQDRLSDDFRGYEDSKAGVVLKYDFNKSFSMSSEIKGSYQGDELELGLQELYLKTDQKGFDAKIGRMRTPLYMNSTIQDDDFSLNTYRGARGFSTERTALETFDGLSVGTQKRLQSGDLELRGLVGVSKDRDYSFYNSKTDSNDEVSLEAEDVWQLEGRLENKYGKFRVAHLEAETGVEDDTLDEFKSTSMGYSLDAGSWFLDAELAKEEVSEVDIDKGYATFGYNFSEKTIPSLTYSQVNQEGTDDLHSIELGLKHELNDNVVLKTSYEKIEQDDAEDDLFSLGVAFKL